MCQSKTKRCTFWRRCAHSWRAVSLSRRAAARAGAVKLSTKVRMSSALSCGFKRRHEFVARGGVRSSYWRWRRCTQTLSRVRTSFSEVISFQDCPAIRQLFTLVFLRASRKHAIKIHGTHFWKIVFWTRLGQARLKLCRAGCVSYT